MPTTTVDSLVFSYLPMPCCADPACARSNAIHAWHLRAIDLADEAARVDAIDDWLRRAAAHVWLVARHDDHRERVLRAIPELPACAGD